MQEKASPRLGVLCIGDQTSEQRIVGRYLGDACGVQSKYSDGPQAERIDEWLTEICKLAGAANKARGAERFEF